MRTPPKRHRISARRAAQPRSVRCSSPRRPTPGRPAFTAFSLDTLAARARARLPGFVETSLFVPAAPGEPVALYGTVAGTPALLGTGSSWARFVGPGWAHDSVFDVRTAPWTPRLDAMVAPLHFGNYGGLPVKLAYAALGLTPGLLSVSGFVLWRLRRQRARTTRRAPPR